MPTYRLYFLDADTCISSPPIVIECINDAVATQQARQFFNGSDIEIWQGSRLVTLLPKPSL